MGISNINILYVNFQFSHECWVERAFGSYFQKQFVVPKKNNVKNLFGKKGPKIFLFSLFPKLLFLDNTFDVLPFLSDHEA